MVKNKRLQFLEYFCQFLSQGYSVQDILELCKTLGYENEYKEISCCLNNGLDLSSALLQCHFSNTFDEYFSFFTNTFSTSDAIEKTLEVCHVQEKITMTLINKLKYPFLLVIFVMMFSLFLVIGLLPKVEELFVEFEITKSLFITVVFTVFKVFPVFMILIIFIGCVSLIYVYFQIKQVNYHFIDNVLTRKSFLSYLIKTYYSLKFALYYNQLLTNHYTTTEALNILYKDMSDNDIHMIVFELNQLIIKGESFEDAIMHFQYFDFRFQRFFLIINKSIHNQSLEDYISMTIHDIERRINRFIQFIVPVIYMFVGFFVIFVYLSIVLPMMNVVSTL